MLREPIALILGAGASFDLGFPLGEALLTKISEELRSFEQGTSNFLQTEIDFGRLPPDLALSSKKAKILAQALNTSRSIDLLIHRLQDEHIAQIAKLCIAKQIIEAESRAAQILSTAWEATPLRLHRNDAKGRQTPYWLHFILEGAVRGVVQGKGFQTSLEEAFESLLIVTFNYDRSVEFFAAHFLSRAFALDMKDALAFVNENLGICHIYGSVDAPAKEFGSLHEQFTCKLDPGGAFDSKRIWHAACNIRTIHEAEIGTEVSTHAEELLEAANSLLLVGNSFIPENFKLIATKKGPNSRYYATCVGLSRESMDQARNLISNTFGSGFQDFRDDWTAAKLCSDLLDLLCE